jgi:hypothetical protein
MAMAVRRERSSAKPGGLRRFLPHTRVRGDRVATWASRVRARILFIVLDAVVVTAAYGVAEVSYFRDKPPAIYWRHFALFLVLALVVHIGANWIFGLYGRIWRYAGIQEARQILVSTLSAFVVLVALRPIWHGLCASTRACSRGSGDRTGSASGWQ